MDLGPNKRSGQRATWRLQEDFTNLDEEHARGTPLENINILETPAEVTDNAYPTGSSQLTVPIHQRLPPQLRDRLLIKYL